MPATHGPLESFLLDYLDGAGGVWDEVEPQVYDVMLPADPDGAGGGLDDGDRDILRVTFDPDALPEHPNSQLASFGTPLVDRLLADARRRGQCGRAFLNGLNLTPHNLSDRAGRALTLPAKHQMVVQHARAMLFPQALFWFEATFVSDHKESQVFLVAFDLSYGRPMRHSERLLEAEGLADEPGMFLPEVKHASPAEVYAVAREHVVRTLVPLANTRRRELAERVERQVARMNRYYEDLRAELVAGRRRAEQQSADVAKFDARLNATRHEQQTRVAELRNKSSLHADVRLASLLVIHQPKLQLAIDITGPRGTTPAHLVWDPFIDSFEAVACPGCARPTFILSLNRLAQLGCPQCTT